MSTKESLIWSMCYASCHKMKMLLKPRSQFTMLKIRKIPARWVKFLLLLMPMVEKFFASFWWWCCYHIEVHTFICIYDLSLCSGRRKAKFMSLYWIYAGCVRWFSWRKISKFLVLSTAFYRILQGWFMQKIIPFNIFHIQGRERNVDPTHK